MSVDPGLESRPPVLSSKIDQLYLPVDRAVPREAPMRYEPALVGYGCVHFDDSKSNVSESRTVFRFIRADSRMRANPWPDAESLPLTANDLDHTPLPEAGFVELPLIERDRRQVHGRGRVVGLGRHAELLETCPLYQRLHGMQFGTA